MPELKTLKDIEFPAEPASIRISGSKVVISEELKQEAIKWIKVIKEKIKLIHKLESKPQSPSQKVATQGLDEVLEGQIKIFRDFFNITEEDLKENE